MKNKKIISITIPLLINLFSLGGYAETSLKDKAIDNIIQNYITSENNLKEAYTGVYFKNITKNKEIVDINSDKLFIPASNTKIYTTLIALEKLGNNFTFKTTFSTDDYRQITKEKFEVNNLYINFSGDPTLTYKDIENMFKSLKEKGISKINGTVYINRGKFDNTFYGAGWMWDDMDSCDSSPIDSLYMDDNCLKGYITYRKDKEYSNEFKNPITIETSSLVEGNQDGLEISNFSNNNLSLKGAVKVGSTYDFEQSIKDPFKYISSFIKPILTEKFSYKGNIDLYEEDYKDSLTLVQHESSNLSEILKRFNKESHNLTGELLMKTVSLTDKKNLRASTKNGIEILKNYLENNYKISNFKFVDGSGLSRYNLTSPKLTLKVLESLYNKENFRNTVLKAFPIGGQDGTLKNRLKTISGYKVIAKSGSMTGVNCLSGYLIPEKKGDVLAFSIMINNSSMSGKILRDIQDRIIKEVTEKVN